MYNYNQSFNGYPIMANDHLPYDPNIMQKIYDRVWGYTHNYSRTFTIVFSLKLPQNEVIYDGNHCIVNFMNRFRKYFERQGLRKPWYVWVREQQQALNHHYHCLVLLDGRYIQHKHAIMREAVRIWGGIIGLDGHGYVDYQWDAWNIRTDSPTYEQDVASLIFASSYLAKTNTKNSAPYRNNNFGASQLPGKFKLVPSL